MPAGLQDYTYLNNYPIKMREILGLAGKRSINIINNILNCITYILRILYTDGLVMIFGQIKFYTKLKMYSILYISSVKFDVCHYA